MADTNIAAGPIEVVLSIKAGISFYPPAPIDVQKNLTFPADPIDLVISIEGDWLNINMVAGPIEVITSILGEWVESVTIAAGPIDVVISIHSDGYVIGPTCNVVRWSKIGELNFTVDQSNLANSRPMDWRGCVWNIMKLGDRVVAYGANGVSFLKPQGVHYGMQTIHRIGIRNKNAIAGNDFMHFFIDKIGRLYTVLAAGLTRLGYEEYLSLMTNPVMSLDDENKLVYICDGTYGYVYSIETDSLGEGPIDVTGFGVRDNVPYVVSSGLAEPPRFEILTDVYDFGTRKSKTVYSVELGTDLTEFLQAKIEYRVNNDESFDDSDWKVVNRDGFAYTRCFGIEFRVRVRSSIYEYLELDYLKINGVLHEYGSLDSYTLRR